MISTDIQKLEQEHPEYIEAVKKNYWWNFIVLMLDSSIFNFSVAMLSQDTIIPFFVSKLTSNEVFIGLVPAIFYLGYFFPQLIGAFIVNGKPTRKWSIFWIAIAERIGILMIALLAQFLGLFSNSMALWLLMFSYLVFSVTNGLIAPGYADFISKNIFRNRGIFYGAMGGLGGLIGFGASLTAAFLLDRYSFPVNLRVLFWIGFGTSFISPFFIASFREIPYPVKRQVEPLIDFIKAIPVHIRSCKGFGRFMLTRAFWSLGSIANAFFALYAMMRFELSESTLGIFTMIILLTQSVTGFLWGWIGDRFGFKHTYVISSVFYGLIGVLSLTALGPWAFYVIAFFIGSTYSVQRTCDPSMVFELAPPSETSRFVGISNTFVAPVMTLAPLIGGLIVNHFSHISLFWIVLVVGVLSTVLTMFYMPNPRAETEG